MEPDFWHKRWRENDIGFHRDQPHAVLQTHWPDFQSHCAGKPSENTVFVPLCGKTSDMAWLADRGHKIIGVELSKLAIEAFFTERGLTPDREDVGEHAVYRSGPYELWCGDIFRLPQHVWDRISSVYERASLVAFPPDMQEQYARLLSLCLPPATPVFLIALDYDPAEMDGPPFNISAKRVEQLFDHNFTIRLSSTERGLTENEFLKKRGLSELFESLYFLRRT